MKSIFLTFSRPSPSRRVKDAPTRITHWLMAICFFVAYITSEGETFRLLHVTMGYTLFGLVVFRLLYGIVGPRQARIAALWRKAIGLKQWCVLAWTQLSQVTTPATIQWRQGRLMLTPALTVLILALTAPITLSGYLTFNAFGGDLAEDFLISVHELFGNALLFTVLTHLGWLVVSSLITRRNEIAPMWHGVMPGAGPDVAKHNHLWLAIAVVLGVVGYITWEWSVSPHGLIRLW